MVSSGNVLIKEYECERIWIAVVRRIGSIII